MKKRTAKKLTLSKETVVSLEAANLTKLVGGATAVSICEVCIYTVNWCVDTH